MDAANAAAIEESIAEAHNLNQLSSDLRLDGQYAYDYRNAKDAIRQCNTLNQFHSHFLDAINANRTSSMICGYLAVAHARMLRSRPEDDRDSPRHRRSAPVDWIRTAMGLLTDEKRVLRETVRVMRSVRRRRLDYIRLHYDDFENDAARALYERALVADYEVADELFRADVDDGGQDEASDGLPNVYLWRPNNYPEVQHATHEERSRILSEDCHFDSDVKFVVERRRRGASHDSEGDVVERFAPDKLREMRGQLVAEEGRDEPMLFVVNSGGHFFVCVAFCTRSSEIEAGVPALCFFNTQDGKIVSGQSGAIDGMMFDALF